MVTWVGSQVGDYLIDQKLGEGNFSWVYRGIHEDDGKYAAFKVAKPTGTEPSANGTNVAFPTRAIATITGGTMDIKPDAAKLLQKQHEQLIRQN